MDVRTERIGKNEALFRNVNERLKGIGESFSLVAELADFICECGDASCAQPIRMTLSEYERIREHPTWFMIVPGHEISDLERVVERHDEFDIIEKRAGDASEVAVAEDPRS